MKKVAKPKNTSPYDANGRWVEERGRIKGAIRRVFRLSPQMKEVLAKARVELPPKTKKDGEPGKKNQVRYRCACCGELFSQKHVQVDHINPVVPLYLREELMSYDSLARGIFCRVENLQVVCSTPKKLSGGKPSCHSLKTNEENYIRSILSVEYQNVGKEVFMIQDNIDKWSSDRIAALKKEYSVHVAEQERLRQEKLQRKLAREAKKKERLDKLNQDLKS